jgi:DNA polymerase-1
MEKVITPKTKKIADKQTAEVENLKIEDDSKKVYRTFEDFSYEPLLTYAGLDVIATSELLVDVFPEIISSTPMRYPGSNGEILHTTAPAIIESIQKYSMPAFEFLLAMEINGIKYDCNRNREISLQMSTEIAELEEKIFSVIGRKINLDSGTEVGKFLYEERDFVAPFKTKSGDNSTDGAALLTLAGLDPLAQKYVASDPELQFLADMAKRRDINSVHNSFISSYIEDWVKRDGRVHPSYQSTGTSGFRISGDNPNLLQLPRAKHGYNVRECFTVENGKVFITLDFSSAEVKALANLCRDPSMLKAIRENLDFHSFSASLMLNVPYEDFVAVLADKTHAQFKHFKLYRQIAKVLTFSLLYGSSVGGIAMQLNMTKEEAQRLMDIYFTAYPGVKRFIEESHQLAIYNKFVVTPFGQRKQEYGAYPVFKSTAAYNAALRNASNIRVQSPTSTLGLMTFTALDQELQKIGAMSICTVYDSIEIECPIERAAECVELGYYYMNDWPVEAFDWLELPVGCDCEIGPNWGVLEGVHRGTSQSEIEEILRKLQ